MSGCVGASCCNFLMQVPLAAPASPPVIMKLQLSHVAGLGVPRYKSAAPFVSSFGT